MFKKLVIAMMCMLPFASFAQNFKFGNINSAEVFDAMPEKAVAQKELDALSAKYEAELQKMSEEFQRKMSDLIASQDSLPENIKQRRSQELGELEQRIQNFRQASIQEFQQQQQAKVQPIFEKITKAIKEVGDENGFTYIFDLNQPTILYFSEQNTVDVLPLVKTKLGLK